MGAGWLAALVVASLQLASPGRAAFNGFNIDLSSLSHPPLWEPTLEEYFPVQRGGERDENGLASPVVLTSPSREEFLHHARKGYPILVSDWGAGMKYDGWTGADFAKHFPFGYMKAEYINELKGFRRQDHDVKIIDGEMRFNLGSFKPDKKTPWHNFSRPASKRYKDDPQKPVTGPYVWHVKDELTPPQKKKVQEHFEAPAFLDDPLNSEWMNRTFELWFSPGSGSGAGAHNDGYCESVVSLQLRGDKKWRKMLEPKMTFLSSYDEFDGGVYQAGLWEPDMGFVNSRAGAVIWPPGYLHETKTLPPADGACGAAITLQFAFPQPVQFLRAFLPRLSLSAEVGQCVVRSWSGYPTFYVDGIKPSADGAVIQKQLDRVFDSVDKDKDGQITVEEARAFFATRPAGLRRGLETHGRRHPELFLQFQAEDTVAYSDLNDDMIASRQEVWEALVQWNVVRMKMSQGLKYVNVADREGLVNFEKSLDYMRREPATFPKRLRPELQQLFALKKGTKVLKSLKGVGSFSDSEFFEQARDRVGQLLRQQQQQQRQTKAGGKAGGGGRAEL